MRSGKRGNILAVAALLLALAVSFVFVFRGSTDDAEIASEFLTHLEAGNHEAAGQMMRRRARAALEDAVEAGRFDLLAPFEHVLFQSRRTSMGMGGRQSELQGTGVTASGCESQLQFLISNGRITFFDIRPICDQSGAASP